MRQVRSSDRCSKVGVVPLSSWKVQVGVVTSSLSRFYDWSSPIRFYSSVELVVVTSPQELGKTHEVFIHGGAAGPL